MQQLIRVYLRVSTEEQDVDRAKECLRIFIQSHNKRIASYYAESFTGTKIERPELNRLIDDSEQGDILVIEKMDRLTRLPYEEWLTLKERIRSKGIVIVVADQPMTHDALHHSTPSAITKVLTDFMLDLGAAMARDDYETMRRRQAQGIARARELGKYKGRQINPALHEDIKDYLAMGRSYTEIQTRLKCSSATIAKVAKLNK